jgi:hypothetical protein
VVRKPQEVDCPREPGHGKTVKRWLRGDYRQVASGGSNAQVADVFEIACPTCGKYEHREDRAPK